MSFAFSPPLAAAASTLSSPFAELLSTSLPHASSLPALIQLADALYAARTKLVLGREMSTLSGALRDEWKVRVGAVKADWMARWIPEEELEEEEGEEGPQLHPTIISDADGAAEMSNRVDAEVEREFAARIAEAEGRVRSAVGSKERMEVELLIGSAVSPGYWSLVWWSGFGAALSSYRGGLNARRACTDPSFIPQVLEAQQEEQGEHEVALNVLAELISACEEVGVEAREVLADRPWSAGEDGVQELERELQGSRVG